MGKKIIIVGGVAGGASAATRLRRLDEHTEIILFEKGEYISFANCGLPYYIGGAIEERDMLFVQTPEAMRERFNIDVRVCNEVLEIHSQSKTITIKALRTQRIYEETYDELILSPGSTPLKPPIPGIESPNIFSLWNVPDVDRIHTHIKKTKPKRAVVIGGGFIGLEMAENLYDRGLEVSIVEMGNQVMAPLDYDMATLVHNHILSKGVRLYLQDGVKEFVHGGNKTDVVLQSGKKLEADLILLSIGIKPNTEFIKSSGVQMNERGAIVVNPYMETSLPHIHAIGDAIEVVDFVTQKKVMIPLAGPANKQGRIVANNIMGRKEAYVGTQGTSVVKVFDLTVAATGNSEKVLKKLEIPYIHSITDSKSHAGYYPGAVPMTLKLIFDREGKILGAQAVGYEGVDKRIDVVAAALRFGKTVYDLEELELAYAPPYSSAKDPVNMAGYVAANILKGDMNVAHWYELQDINPEQTILLDIRENVERELGAMENSIHIPLDTLRARLSELPKDKEIIVYCQMGQRAYIAYRILVNNGFRKVRNLSGGYKFYHTILTTEEHLANLKDQWGDETVVVPDENRQELYTTETGDIRLDVLEQPGEVIKLNACGLSCPGPILQVYQKMNEMKPGEILEVTATDPGFQSDIGAWAQKTGNLLLNISQAGANIVARLQKGRGNTVYNISTCSIPPTDKDNKTLVVFSGDLDKAIASFIIANGAAAMGKKVTMFFTFWGLNILRKHESVSVKKDLLSVMFGKMMPRGSKRLSLSKMNMLGMGAKMIRGVMDKKNIFSLEELIQQAKSNGVRLIACNMSMDVMGIHPEELVDGVEMGGVATYLSEAEDANVNLFI